MRLAQQLVRVLQEDDMNDISACENLLESYFAQVCPSLMFLLVLQHFLPAKLLPLFVLVKELPEC